MSADHFRVLRAAIRRLDTPELRQRYRVGDFPRSDAVKDLDKRYRWDLFWAARGSFRGTPAYNVAAELSDAHIDTALRRIVGPLNTERDDDGPQDV